MNPVFLNALVPQELLPFALPFALAFVTLLVACVVLLRSLRDEEHERRSVAHPKFPGTESAPQE